MGRAAAADRGAGGPGGGQTWDSRSRPVRYCVAYNNLAGMLPWHRRRYTLLNVCATGAALAAAAASGLTATDMGLGREELRPGLRLGSAAAAATAGGWVLIAAVPATRPVLRDERIAGLSGRAVAYQVLVRIPLGTVLWEETAFRGDAAGGAVPGHARRRRDRGDQWRVRHLAHRPHRGRPSHQRAGGRPAAGPWPPSARAWRRRRPAACSCRGCGSVRAAWPRPYCFISPRTAAAR